MQAQKMMPLEDGMIQQYKLLKESEFASDVVGEFVFLNGNKDEASGFVSSTDGLTYIQVTLFEPIKKEILPPMLFDVLERVDAMAVFDLIADEMSDEIKDEWKVAIDESGRKIH